MKVQYWRYIASIKHEGNTTKTWFYRIRWSAGNLSLMPYVQEYIIQSKHRMIEHLQEYTRISQNIS